MAEVFKREWIVYDRKTREPIIDKKSGEPVRRRSGKYYIRYRDADGAKRTVVGFTDREATETKGANIERAASRKRVGLVDPFEEHRARKLIEHLDDYEAALKARASSPKYVRQTRTRIEAILSGCRFSKLADLENSPGRVIEWLADRRRPMLNIGDKEKEPKAAMSAKTSNYYLRDLKSFATWLVRERRLAANPLTHLSPINANTDERRERRTLSHQELEHLIAGTQGAGHYRGISWPDRVMLYKLALGTGFRASELASLSADSFQLDGGSPTVTVEAGYSKRRRRDVQTIKQDLAEAVRVWLAGKQKQQRGEQRAVLQIPGPRRSAPKLWPGTWRTNAAEMIRIDLEAVGLPYVDDDGRVFDFHALRHQFITGLAGAGVKPKVAQTLARHSTITLTMDRYTHVELFDLQQAVESLPTLNCGSTESHKATGTDQCALLGAFHSGCQGGPNVAKGGQPHHATEGTTAIALTAYAEADLASQVHTPIEEEKREAPVRVELTMADLQSVTNREKRRQNGTSTDARYSARFNDPRLERLIVFWDRLPEHARATIAELVQIATR